MKTQTAGLWCLAFSKRSPCQGWMLCPCWFSRLASLRTVMTMLSLRSYLPVQAQHVTVVYQVWMEGGNKGGREERGRKDQRQGLVPRVCGHLTTILSLYPFPACWEPSCFCHHPQSLQVSQNSAASLSSSIFLQTNEGLDPPSRLHRQAGCQLQWHLFLSEKLRRK